MQQSTESSFTAEPLDLVTVPGHCHSLTGPNLISLHSQLPRAQLGAGTWSEPQLPCAPHWEGHTCHPLATSHDPLAIKVCLGPPLSHSTVLHSFTKGFYKN